MSTAFCSQLSTKIQNELIHKEIGTELCSMETHFQTFHVLIHSSEFVYTYRMHVGVMYSYNMNIKVTNTAIKRCDVMM